jgi:hypothetical protein
MSTQDLIGVAEKGVQDADCAVIKNMESSGFAGSRPNLWAQVAASNELVGNHLPRKRHKGSTPMQALDSTIEFDLSRIIGKPTGCLSFATKPCKGQGLGSQQKGKSKIHACALVGHQTLLASKDCYRLVKLDNGRMITARSVKFYPNVFPFKRGSPDWRAVPVPSAEEFQQEGSDSESDSDDSNDEQPPRHQERKNDEGPDSVDDQLVPQQQQRYPTRTRVGTQLFNTRDYDLQSKHDRSRDHK